VLENQGLSAVAFFEATAFIILLVLFVLLRRDHPTRFLKTWTIGWTILTVKALLELTQVTLDVPQLRLPRVLLLVIVNLVFLKSVFQQARGARGAVGRARADLSLFRDEVVRPSVLHRDAGGREPGGALSAFP
jgi:hypothetical protein